MRAAMIWQALRERIAQLLQSSAWTDLASLPRPDRSASDDVIDEYFLREGERRDRESLGREFDHEMALLRGVHAMLWDAVPPEEHTALAQRIQEMRRDHYRLPPADFRAKYHQYLDDGEKAQE